MAQFVETSYGAEGNDKLRDFLLEYNDKLKNVDAIYKKLNDNDLDYDELMDFGENDFRDTMNELDITKLEISRLLSVLRITEASRIYKEEQSKTINSKVIVLSFDEQNALSNLKKQNENISKAIENIKEALNNLDENHKKGTQIINKNFNYILEKVEKRQKELLHELDTKTNDKKQKLLKQMNEYTSYQKEFNEYNEKSHKLIRDISIDEEKRKSKILSTINDILNKITVPNINEFELSSIPFVIVNININDAINELSGTGSIGNVSWPPLISIKSIQSTLASITLSNHTKNKESNILHPIEYKIKIGEAINDDENKTNDDDDDDMKVQWKTNIIRFSDNLIYECKSLKASTTYKIRVSSRNKNGWGSYSKCISFTTINAIKDEWDEECIGNNMILSDEKKTITINSTIGNSAYCKKEVSTGIHEWTFIIKQCGNASGIAWYWTIGIFKIENDVRPATESYFAKGIHKGYGYGIDIGQLLNVLNGVATGGTKYGIKCKTGDIVTMRVDLETFTLSYTVNGEEQGIAYRDIDHAKYRAAIDLFNANDAITLMDYKQI